MSTELLERPDTSLDDFDEDDEFAHIVIDKAGLAEALVNGTPVHALCGKVWVPSKNPEKFPVCKRCLEVAERGGYDVSGLR